MFEVDDSIFVLERHSGYFGDENMVKVDLKTLKTNRVFSTLRNGLLAILPLNGGTLLAASEALAQFGHCLAVGSFSPTKLTLIDLNSPVPSVVADVDLDPFFYELPNIARVSIAPQTGLFFMRSIGINSDIEGMPNSVFSFFSPDWISKCQTL